MSSLHEAEVERRFDALQARFRASIDAEDYRLRGIIDAIGPVEGLRILDLGCGKGRFAKALQTQGARVVGLDLSAGMLAEADGVLRVRGSVRRLPFASGSFDAAIAVEVFEHLDRSLQAAAIAEASRVLRHEGMLVVIDKNLGSLSANRPWLPSAAVKRIDELRGLWMYPAGGPVRERWFWPASLRSALRRRFDRVQVAHLLSPAERERWLFRHLPSARLMTLWAASAPGGVHV